MKSKLIALSLGSLALVSGALAQATPPPDPLDFTTSLESVQADLGSMITTNGPALLGIVVIMAAFVFVIRWVRKLAKGG